MGQITSSLAGGPVMTVAVVGAVSARDRSRLETAIRGAAARPVVVDLSVATLIDAAIARTLRNANARHARDGIAFAAAGATGQPLRVLEVIGIAKEIGAYLTVAEALAEAGATAGTGSRTPLDARVHRLVLAARAVGTSPVRRDALLRDAAEAGLPLARSLARRYHGGGEPLEDLVQVASIGLVNAVQGYDPERGGGFLAYAVPTVLGELRRHFRDHGWMVRPPRGVQEIRAAVAGARADLTQVLARTPTPRDLGAHLGIPEARVAEAIAAGGGRRTASLDAPAGDGTGRTLHDVLGADDRGYGLTDARIALRPAVAALPDRDREILLLRISTDLTQAEIGQRVGTSQMGVSRSLARSLARLRAVLCD